MTRLYAWAKNHTTLGLSLSLALLFLAILIGRFTGAVSSLWSLAPLVVIWFFAGMVYLFVYILDHTHPELTRRDEPGEKALTIREAFTPFFWQTVVLVVCVLVVFLFK